MMKVCFNVSGLISAVGVVKKYYGPELGPTIYYHRLLRLTQPYSSNIPLMQETHLFFEIKLSVRLVRRMSLFIATFQTRT